MPFLLIGGIALIGLFFAQKSLGASSSDSDLSLGVGSMEKLYNLKDIDPDMQGGTYKRDHDFAFESASIKTGVPFALLKAHAIMESSLNPKAFRDENPTKRTDRTGWASRGLMQLLYWPNSTRFEKYGYKSKTGEELFDVNINTEIAAQLIADNLKSVGGNLRDSINMYNTGKKESQYQAPHDYVNRVIKNYETLIKGKV